MIESTEKLNEMASIGFDAARAAAKRWKKRPITPIRSFGPQWVVEEHFELGEYVGDSAAFYTFETEQAANEFLGLIFMKIALLAIDGEGVKP